MKSSRREWSALLAAAAAGMAGAAPKPALKTKIYVFEDLPKKPNGANIGRAVLDGTLRTGFPIEMHMTEIAAGAMPHAAHKHVHEELLMLQVGILEVNVEGRKFTMTAGSTAFVGSNEEHGWTNVGKDRARYFVMALGRET